MESKHWNLNEPIPEPEEINVEKYSPPKEYRVYPHEETVTDIKKLIDLIDNNSPEKIIDTFLTQHKGLIGYVMNRYCTGHQGCWVIPKKIIKTKTGKNDKGLIPDFILGGQSTSSKEWFVVELKGANELWFVEKGGHLYFSNEMNKGIHQLLEYLDHCETYQSKFRDEYRLTDFMRPKAILIAGRRKEFDNNPRKQSIKKVWETLLGKKLEIMTYDTLKIELESRLREQERPKESITTNDNKHKPFNPFDEPLNEI